MAVTIHDVAKRLNLSITTVSRALDGYDDVAVETRERVIRVAQEMGYAPSRAARQLRRQQAEAIGYIIPTIKPRYSDPSFSEFIAGLGDEIATTNFDLVISTAPPGDAAEQNLYQRWVQSRRVDGIVLSRMRRSDWRVGYLKSAGFHFVATAHAHDEVDFPYVEVDAQAGMALLVDHLARQGHRRIAYAGGPEELTLQVERLAGYAAALEKLRLPFDPALLVNGDLTRSGGFQAVRPLLDLPDPPTAVVCANDLTAIGVLRLAQERGLVVGRDLAVTGFDGIEDAETTQPPLTTLDQPVYEIARRLARMLLALVAGEKLEEPHVMLQPNLIVRASSGG